MARLPSSADLSRPASLRSGRAIAATDTSAIGRGVQSFGASVSEIGSNIVQQQNAVDLARAEAFKTQRFLEIENEFANDPDYATAAQRAGAKATEAVSGAAGTIRDASLRERWSIGAGTDAAAVTDAVNDRGVALKRQAETEAFTDALEAERRIYVDPNTPEPVRTKARADIEGAIAVGLSTGLLTPSQADEMRKVYLEDADYSRGLLAVENGQFDGALPALPPPGSSAGAAPLPELEFTDEGKPIDPDNQFLMAEDDPRYMTKEQYEAAKAAAASQPQGGATAGDSVETSASLLRQFEGFRETPYWDVNANRIGYGSDTVTKADGTVVRVVPGMAVTREDAERDLARRIGITQQQSAKEVGQEAWDRLPVHIKGALTSVAYNYGEIPSRIRDAVQSGDPERIADAVASLQNDNDGVNRDRRLKEAAIIRGQGNPDWYTRLSPEQQALINAKDRERRAALDVELRSTIETTTANAPAAVANTGEYSGRLPTVGEFVQAYGPVQGREKFDAFSSDMQVAQTSYGMRSMSNSQIAATLAEAVPTSSGNDAALETARYAALTKAAESTLAARAADPVGYVQQVFPQVTQAWSQADTPQGARQALSVTQAAQEQLGIVSGAMLPKTVAQTTVQSFNNGALPEADRIGALTQMVFATDDAEQQRAIFRQLVAEGVPEITEGAMEALARGDDGAAKRLFQAALVDPSNLPGKIPETPARISEEIQAKLMTPGAVGDVYYGLSDGQVENFERATRAAKLMQNAVSLRLLSGESLGQAVDSVAKDLFGDVQVLGTNWQVGARVLLPADQDPAPYVSGFTGLKETVREALRFPIPEGVGNAQSERAIVDAATSTYIEGVLDFGYFTNSGDGYVYMDPFVGAPIAGPDGKPLTFTDADVSAAAEMRAPLEGAPTQEQGMEWLRQSGTWPGMAVPE